MQLLPIILAGGAGSRLSPLSTPDRPKPFIPFRDGRSLYQLTLKRCADAGMLPPLVIGSAQHRYGLQNHARDLGLLPSAMLLETTPLGTALAVCVAVQWAKLHQPQATLVILPCDHVFGDDDAWVESLRALAVRLAARQKIGLLGAAISAPPSSEVGYIEAGDAGQMLRFVEKPSSPEVLLERGHWYSNCGQFIGSVQAFSALFTRLANELCGQSEALLRAAEPEFEFLKLPAHAGIAPSFDRVVLEHAGPTDVLVEKLCTDFSDVGTVTSWCAHTQQSWEDQCRAPMRTERPWGYFYSLSESNTHREKELHVYTGQRLSMQRHFKRSEHWRVIRGQANVWLDGMLHELSAGNALDIPISSWHRLINTSADMLVIHETQRGMPTESDIERAEDDYGRVVSYQACA